MALTLDELQVIITAKTEGLEKAINNTNLKIDSLSKKGVGTSSTLAKAFKAISTGAAVVAITKLTKSCVSLGMEAQETAGMFESVFGSSTNEMQSWINDVNNVLGVSITQLQRETAYIYSMANAMGLGETNSTKMSKGIAGLSEDLSHFYNVSSDVAYQKLQSALVGNTEGLKAWGIILDDATLKQVAYSKGIAQVGTELTQQQKVMARYEAILLQTKSAQGSAVRELSGLTSQVTMLKNNFAQLGTTIGGALVGPLAKALSYANAVVKAINIVISELFGVKQEANSTSSSVGGISTGFEEATDNAKKLKKQLAGFDDLNVLSSQEESSSLPSVGGGGYEITDYDLGLDSVDEKAEKIADKLRTIVSIVSELYNTWLKPVVDFVVSNGNVILSILVGIGTAILVWNGYFAALNLVSRISTVFTAVQGLWALLMANPIVAVIALVAGIVASLVVLYNTNEDFRNAVDKTWTKVKEWFTDGVQAIQEKFQQIGQAITDFKDGCKERMDNIKSGFTEAFQNVSNKMVNFRQTVKESMTNVKNSVSEMFTNLKQKTGDFFDNIKEKVSTKTKSILNKYVISPVNKLISWINSKLHFSYSGLNILGKQVIPSFNVRLANLKSIPQLAKGGVVDSPTLAMIGEKGKEAVVPLENNTEWMNKLNFGGDTEEIIKLLKELITVVKLKPTGINKKDIGKSAVEYINKQKRIQGGELV